VCETLKPILQAKEKAEDYLMKNHGKMEVHPQTRGSGSGCARVWVRVCTGLGQGVHESGSGCVRVWVRVCTGLGAGVHESGSGCARVWVRVCTSLGPGVHGSGSGCARVWVRVCAGLGPGVCGSGSGCARVWVRTHLYPHTHTTVTGPHTPRPIPAHIQTCPVSLLDLNTLSYQDLAAHTYTQTRTPAHPILDARPHPASTSRTPSLGRLHTRTWIPAHTWAETSAHPDSDTCKPTPATCTFGLRHPHPPGVRHPPTHTETRTPAPPSQENRTSGLRHLHFRLKNVHSSYCT
jgi:hypothetical protein